MVEKNDELFLKKQWFIKSQSCKVEEVYDIDLKKVLGSGTYGNVYKTKKKGTKIVRAVKQIPK